MDVRGGIVRAGGAIFGRTRSVAEGRGVSEAGGHTLGAAASAPPGAPAGRALRPTQSMNSSAGAESTRGYSLDVESRGGDDQDAFALLDAESADKVAQLLLWDLDAWDLDHAELSSLMVHMFHHQNLLKRFGLRPIVLEDFIDAVKDHYRRVLSAMPPTDSLALCVYSHRAAHSEDSLLRRGEATPACAAEEDAAASALARHFSDQSVCNRSLCCRDNPFHNWRHAWTGERMLPLPRNRTLQPSARFMPLHVSLQRYLFENVSCSLLHH